MKVKSEHYRTIWPSADGEGVWIIDQTVLPHVFETRKLKTLDEAAEAIRAMRVRGAPLIGATAAYGIYLAMRTDASDRVLASAYDALLRTRPTAVNLRWALDRVRSALAPLDPSQREAAALVEAGAICEADVTTNQAIGQHGLELIRRAAARRRRAGETGPVQILTHCNAGWLGTVDWGTALAPIYLAHEEGIGLHVWVDETRPRNQGANLTTWELAQHGVPYSLIVDNVGGHLMQHNQVDLCIVGADRVTSQGDVCNKIGTYLKALAAWDNGVPFYVALPSSTIDWTIEDGVEEIPIEERSSDEVTRIAGVDDFGRPATVHIAPEGCPAKNYGFDVTPQRLVTAFITERGLCAPSANGLRGLFADLAPRRAALACRAFNPPKHQTWASPRWRPPEMPPYFPGVFSAKSGSLILKQFQMTKSLSCFEGRRGSRRIWSGNAGSSSENESSSCGSLFSVPKMAPNTSPRWKFAWSRRSLRKVIPTMSASV